MSGQRIKAMRSVINIDSIVDVSCYVVRLVLHKEDVEKTYRTELRTNSKKMNAVGRCEVQMRLCLSIDRRKYRIIVQARPAMPYRATNTIAATMMM